MDIAIVGYGVVGQALHSFLERSSIKHNIRIYDPNKGYNDDVKYSAYCFICVNTDSKEKGEFDGTCLDNVYNMLLEKKYCGTVVIKSTCLPEYAEKFAKCFCTIVNPEFLNENTAFYDIKNQYYHILGGNYDLCKEYAERIIKNINPESTVEYLSICDACNAKYVWNIKNALEVLFWNFVNRTFGHEDVMSRVYNRLHDDIDPVLNIVGKGGELGFGGRCFPKDVSAINQKYHDLFTSFMLEYNNDLKDGDTSWTMK